jgi:hypothetical protein
MKPFRRFNPKPPYAYCRSRTCRWSDPDRAHGKPLEPLGVSVEQAARAHVAVFGHEVRLVRTQEVVLRPAELAEVTK